jgi:hypothetical protein
MIHHTLHAAESFYAFVLLGFLAALVVALKNLFEAFPPLS